MKADRMTKILLVVIAFALWIIALEPYLRPRVVEAQSRLEGMVVGIYVGQCPNKRICGQ